MRLKKLTLFGFKSFPNRTKIEFSRGICAIVGPNGCGKSNVVDAIRWVLGEQSARMLRARTMDDVIFSGSNGRKVSFAEVSLVLENREGMAPPEFENLPEIEIRRMVSRSGDTRYLLNGRNCRLKDIHYLLMDTGAGTRAYSIVDQGQVGQFVEMSPRERRHIIEEVAGISRYKARRVEAERRMADTERNLERLNDLMSEVDRQLKSASRQARKTERYLELRKEEETLDRALLRFAWDEQKERLEALEADMERASEAHAVEEAGFSSLRDRREEIRARLLETEDNLKRLRTGLSGAEELLERLRAEKAAAEKELYGIRLKLKSVEENERESTRRAAEIARKLEEVESALGKLRRQEKELKREEEAAEGQVQDALVHVGKVRSELEDVKIRLVDAAAEQARLDSDRRSLEERRQRLELRIERREQEQEALREKVASLEVARKEAEARLGKFRDKYTSVTARAEALRDELSSLSVELERAGKHGREVESRLAASSARLNALKDVDAAGEGIPPEVMRMVREEPGVKGLLADFIEVEPGWELLFETVLGARLHTVIVQDRNTCARIAESFRKKSASMLNMLVVPDRSGEEPGAPLAADADAMIFLEPCTGSCTAAVTPDISGLEPLWRHARAAPSVASAVSAFIHGAVRAESLEAALEFWDQNGSARNPGETPCRPLLVTPQGDTIGPGLEVGVRGGGDSASGILVRKAMIRKLEEETSATEAELESINRRRDALAEAESRIRKQAAGLEEEARGIEKSLAALTRELESITVKLESSGSRLKVMELEAREAAEELLDVECALEERETALEECTKRNQELSASLKGREGALKQQEGVLERRRRHHQELKIRLARLESSIREHQKEKQRLGTRRERMGRESRNFAVEKKRLEQELEGLEARLGTLDAKASAQERAVHEARARVRELEQQRDAVLQEAATIEDRITATARLVRAAEKRLHALEVELSETRQGLRFIRQSALERHNISPAAITGVEYILKSMQVEEIKEKLDALRSRIGRMGAVNLQAIDEYNELKERWEFLHSQKQDLESSMADLRQAMDKINRTCRKRFREAMDAVNRSLDEVFPLLFDGGSGRLRLEGAQDVLEAGVDYMVNLPGKKIQHLNLLSGGEKTMAAMALLFAVYFIKPSPFCLLDEVDAPLDEANTVRFNRLIRKIAARSQVVIITHNQRVMDCADTLYGVTMEDKGVSKVVSVNLVSG